MFDGIIHAVDENGVRYKIDFNTNKVYKLTFNEMFVNAYDFSTPYNVQVLRNNLLVNLK